MARAWVAFAAVLVAAASANAQRATLTDQQITEVLIRESRQAYYATGHPCACPEDLARNGTRCGAQSAYSRPGALQPRPGGSSPGRRRAGSPARRFSCRHRLPQLTGELVGGQRVIKEVAPAELDLHRGSAHPGLRMTMSEPLHRRRAIVLHARWRRTACVFGDHGHIGPADWSPPTLVCGNQRVRGRRSWSG